MKIQPIGDPEAPEKGGAHAHYLMTRTVDNLPLATLSFQQGSILEAGENGVTIEALLEICAHRLQEFQNGKFSCCENEQALANIRCALDALRSRTKRRVDSGIEGTYAEL